MKTPILKAVLLSAFFLSSTYVANEFNLIGNNLSVSPTRTIAKDAKTDVIVSSERHVVYREGVLDKFFHTNKLIAKVFGAEETHVVTNVVDTAEIQNLRLEVNDLNKNAEIITEELVAKSEAITELEEKISSLKSDKSHFQQKQSAMEKHIQQLTNEVEDKKQELVEVQDTLNKLDETNENLKKLEATIVELKTENAKLKEENLQLQCQLEVTNEAQEKIIALEDQLEAIELKLAKAEEDSSDVKAKKDDNEDREDKLYAELKEAMLDLYKKEEKSLQSYRAQQNDFLYQRMISPYQDIFTPSQFNNSFGGFDSFERSNMGYLNMVQLFNEQSMMMNNMNSMNNTNYGYNHYYGKDAPYMGISQHMPWGMQMTQEQALPTQGYDYARHGYNFGFGASTGLNNSAFQSTALNLGLF